MTGLDFHARRARPSRKFFAVHPNLRITSVLLFVSGFGMLAAACVFSSGYQESPNTSEAPTLTPSTEGIALYSGNNCEDSNVGVTDDAPDQFIQFTTTNRFKDNEARSLLFGKLSTGTIVRLFDHPAGDTSDDWVEILVKQKVEGYCVISFETSFEDVNVSVEFSHVNGLDGNVSLMTVDRAMVEIHPTTQNPTPHPEPTVATTSTLMPTLAPPPEIPPLPETECIPLATELEYGTVLDVVDGDTIDILIERGRFRLRYIGLDAPEAGEPFFNQATSKNAELVLGKTVTLIKDVTESDEDGNILRYVLAGNTFVNYSLVREGSAKALAFPPDVACSPSFAEAQNQAVGEEAGLWAIIPAPPAPTHTPASVPNIQITVILYSGTDPGVEGDEFVQITNQGLITVNLQGWRLNAGELEQDFYFPDFLLDPGLSCRIYTNEDHPENCGFSFRAGKEVWNNEGDCGYLYDNEGAQVSKYCY